MIALHSDVETLLMTTSHHGGGLSGVGRVMGGGVLLSCEFPRESKNLLTSQLSKQRKRSTCEDLGSSRRDKDGTLPSAQTSKDFHHGGQSQALRC